MLWLIVEGQLQVARYALGVKRFDFDAGLAPTTCQPSPHGNA